ncbi:uncharacterized protein LOC117339055 [Pecten maximus]|uniref:uncharacterized protein LOC117339055 n=1 Tax=Pecten maximus TaxID=6579 RepID=UPI00145908DF|nr:uncharacterized protein LOC117339055 [Pecten maximus]
MVDPTIARRAVSRYRLYLAGAVLIAVAVLSYYFMNLAPNKLSKNSLESKSRLKVAKNAKMWKQNKFISNSVLKTEMAQQRRNPDKLSLTDHHKSEILKPPMRAPVQDNVAFKDQLFGSPKTMETRRPATEHLDMWRITNESRFYGPISDYADYFRGMKRLVHLDLKGAPPNKLYLQRLFPLFKTFGATGVILEYEDMFPYKDRFSVIAAKNCYSEEDIKEILRYAANSELEIIPLIPTFGHLEFLLKHEKFRHMRDVDSSPFVISPALDATYVILTEMVQQVMRLHNTSSYVHIGAGGVTEIGRGLSASLINKGKTREDIMLEHVFKVSRIVKEKFNKQPIMWDDMLRSMDVKKLQESQLGQYVQPMVWSSMTNPADKLTSDIWSKYRDTFKHLWVASSFKGSTGSGRVMTDAVYHLKNHLNWIHLIEAIGPGARDQEQAVKIIGIGIIGRQRYSHFSTLCELLPAGIPSLAVSLKVMQFGGFTESVHRLVSKQLKCEKPVKLDLLKKYRDYDGCKFPGSAIYYKLRTLWGKLQTYSTVKENINSFASEINYKHQFFDPNELKRINTSLLMLNASLSGMDGFMRHEISTYFDAMTATEWVEINIRQTVQEITQEVNEIAEFSKRKTWANRPGYDASTSAQNSKGKDLNNSKTDVIKPLDQDRTKKEQYMPKLTPLQQLKKIRSRFNQSRSFQADIIQRAAARLQDNRQKYKTDLKPGLNNGEFNSGTWKNMAALGQKSRMETVNGKVKTDVTERKTSQMGGKSGIGMVNGGMKTDVTERKTSQIGGKSGTEMVNGGMKTDVTERKTSQIGGKSGTEMVNGGMKTDVTERKTSQMGGKSGTEMVNGGMKTDVTERKTSQMGGKSGTEMVNGGMKTDVTERKTSQMGGKSGTGLVNGGMKTDVTERKTSQMGGKSGTEMVNGGMKTDVTERKTSQMGGKSGIGMVNGGMKTDVTERKTSQMGGKSGMGMVNGGMKTDVTERKTSQMGGKSGIGMVNGGMKTDVTERKTSQMGGKSGIGMVNGGMKTDVTERKTSQMGGKSGTEMVNGGMKTDVTERKTSQMGGKSGIGMVNGGMKTDYINRDRKIL